jgi:hypothetical protein
VHELVQHLHVELRVGRTPRRPRTTTGSWRTGLLACRRSRRPGAPNHRRIRVGFSCDRNAALCRPHSHSYNRSVMPEEAGSVPCAGFAEF